MIEVSYRTWDGSDWVDNTAMITAPEEINTLLNELVRRHADDIIAIHHDRPTLPSGYPDHELAIGVREDRAALRYDGDDNGDGGGTWYTRGNGPDHPVEYAQGEFPPQCEVPIDQLAEALHEFLTTARRPTVVEWQEFEFTT